MAAGIEAVGPGASPVRRRRRFRRALTLLAVVAALAVLAIGGPVAWTRAESAGHLYSSVADAPSAPVVVVFGAELAPGGQRPKSFLAGRLDVAAELVRAGKAKAILVSGDATGYSGNEVAVMTRYLVDRGVEARRIVSDPDGLDTYDTCVRAARVYGVRRALLVSQPFHLPRAVTLCRRSGIDADGVGARCHPCRVATLRKNKVREVGADLKAVWDVVLDRQPAVSSPPDRALTDALRD
jgi:vancomycin permeability regulator SanA